MYSSWVIFLKINNTNTKKLFFIIMTVLNIFTLTNFVWYTAAALHSGRVTY